jgi:hypothetical protein
MRDLNRRKDYARSQDGYGGKDEKWLWDKLVELNDERWDRMWEDHTIWDSEGRCNCAYQGADRMSHFSN